MIVTICSGIKKTVLHDTEAWVDRQPSSDFHTSVGCSLRGGQSNLVGH